MSVPNFQPKNFCCKTLLSVGLLLICVRSMQAAESAAPATSGDAHSLQPLVLLGIAVMLLVGKLGGEVFERFKQPTVLGELIGGIVLGNLVLFGFSGAEPLKTN